MATGKFNIKDVSTTQWSTNPSGFTSASSVYQRVSGNVSIVNFTLAPSSTKTAASNYEDVCTLRYSCLNNNGVVVASFSTSAAPVQFRINGNKLQFYCPYGWTQSDSMRGQIVTFIE